MVITAIQEKEEIIASYKKASETFNKIKNNTILIFNGNEF